MALTKEPEPHPYSFPADTPQNDTASQDCFEVHFVTCYSYLSYWTQIQIMYPNLIQQLKGTLRIPLKSE
jgi:hypothetical protein